MLRYAKAIVAGAGTFISTLAGAASDGTISLYEWLTAIAAMLAIGSATAWAPNKVVTTSGEQPKS